MSHKPKRDEIAGLPRYLSRAEILELTGLSRSTLWREIKAGRFPEPSPIAKGSVGWRVDVIRRWQDEVERRA